MKLRSIAFLVAICACAMVVLPGSALAYFPSAGNGTSGIKVSEMNAPSITSASYTAGGTVTLKWSEIEAPGPGPVTYYVTRNGGMPSEACPDIAGPEALTTCTDSGLNPGTYNYIVVAKWSTWTKASAVSSVEVKIGAVTKFTFTGNTASPGTGAGPYLTITAKDSGNTTVTTYSGSHTFTFTGASASAEGKVPTVANAAGTAIQFGEPTTLTFTNGIASGASLKNGYVQIYKPGEAKISATEGSLTTPTLALNVLPTATRFVLSAAQTTLAAGGTDALTIKAYDAYGNASTNYTGSHSLIFSGAATSPGGNIPTVENSSGTPVAFGTATAITFTAGVATAEGTNGEMVLYASGAPVITAKEGSTVTTLTGATVTVTPLATVSLGLTSNSINFANTSSPNLTLTAKDTYGNTTPSYNGTKNLTFTATGAPAETSPANNIPGVYNTAGTLIPFGSTTAITFTNGTVTGASNKSGTYRLFKPGTSNLTVTDGTFSSPALGLTVTNVAKRLAVTGLTSSPGTVSSTCYLTCSVTGLGNSGTVTAALTITDEYGNPISNLAAKNVTVTSTAGSSINGSPLTTPESGTATTTTKFTYTAPPSGTYSNSIVAASTGYTSVTITTSK